MGNTTQTFLAGLMKIMENPLPDVATQAARVRLLDYLGCTLAGAEMERDRMLRLVSSSNDGGGTARLIGLGQTSAPMLAALVNGTNAHVAELDDGNRFGMVHPGAPVISAILAQAKAAKLSDEDILMGIVIGYETTIRLARAVQPRAKDNGLHATGICGTVGAAVGVAAALGLQKTELNAALSGGATAASGLISVIRGTSQLKPFNSGHAAQAGLSAAMMAQAGFLGPVDVLGGQHGYLHVMSGDRDVPASALGETSSLCVDNVYVKPYASCRHCHAPVEAALKLRKDHGLADGDIACVVVRTHRMAVHLHDHIDITGVHSAKMSVPYCVAAALVTGEAGMVAFETQRVTDPTILKLTRRIEVHADSELTAQVPKKRAAIVEIHLHNGASFNTRIDLPKGEPETALSASELRAKFMDLSQFGGLNSTRAKQIAQQILEPCESDNLVHTLSLL